jgi:hypothetical protein
MESVGGVAPGKELLFLSLHKIPLLCKVLLLYCNARRAVPVQFLFQY